MAHLDIDNIYGSDSHAHSSSTTDANGMDTTQSDVVNEDMEEEFRPQADDEEDGEVNSGPLFTGTSASEAPTGSMSETVMIHLSLPFVFFLVFFLEYSLVL